VWTLLAKLAPTPAIVVCSTLVERRYGGAISGWLPLDLHLLVPLVPLGLAALAVHGATLLPHYRARGASA
jgi:hypothetical protein